MAIPSGSMRRSRTLPSHSADSHEPSVAKPAAARLPSGEPAMTGSAEPNTVTMRDGSLWWQTAKGDLTPDELVKTQDRLRDRLVREILAKAEGVAAAIAEFKTMAFGEVDAFGDVLSERYGAPIGGEKGNISLISFDGRVRVQVQVADQIAFGEELQAAKSLVTECVKDWSSGARAELRKLALDAFDADKEGKINRSRLLSLLRLEIEDPRWERAMQAIRDSIRVVGSKRYIRVHKRASPKDAWQPVVLDAAAA
ncbi:MAG TPA: DUF3164 family protein [Caulobacteraceae bacterium]|nr:DUF3164 family protein [Caulobacteraceae bacterium]